MSTSNGQIANANTFNNAFVSKQTLNQDVDGTINLKNTSSGADVVNVQQEINNIKTVNSNQDSEIAAIKSDIVDIKADLNGAINTSIGAVDANKLLRTDAEGFVSGSTQRYLGPSYADDADANTRYGGKFGGEVYYNTTDKVYKQWSVDAAAWIVLGVDAVPIASDIEFTPVGDVSATDVQAAIAEVDSEATKKATLTTKGDIYAATGASAVTRLGVGANGEVLTADSTTATGLKWAPQSGGSGSSINPNMIINGGFTYFQRGLSFPAVSDTYTADRFVYSKSAAGVINVARSTDVPTIAQIGNGVALNSAQITVATAATPGAGDYSLFEQRMEGNIASALYAGGTFSFWIKSNNTGTLAVAFSNRTSTSTYVSTVTINAINTWEKKIVTVPIVSGIFDTGNTIGMVVRLTLGSGSAFETGTPNAWNAGNFVSTAGATDFSAISGCVINTTAWKFEPGTTATTFTVFGGDQVSDLEGCWRYYLDISTWSGGWTGWSGTSQNTLSYYTSGVDFPVQMRAVPSVTLSNQEAVQFPATPNPTSITASGYREVRTANASNNNARYLSRFSNASAEL